jgi:hypothetical protein
MALKTSHGKPKREKHKQNAFVDYALYASFLYALLYAAFIATQRVELSGWEYHDTYAGDCMNCYDSNWTKVEMPSAEYNKQIPAYYRGEVRLSGIVKPSIEISTQGGLAELYINGQRITDYKKAPKSQISITASAVIVNPKYFTRDINEVVAYISGSNIRILGINAHHTGPFESPFSFLFYCTPIAMLLLLARKNNVNFWFILMLFTATALVFLKPMLHDFNYWGLIDWDFATTFNAVAKEAVLKYHQIPLWNMYAGHPLFADPQSNWLTPTFILTLLIDVVYSMKIQIIAWYIAGMTGMYLLGRHFKLGVLSSCIMAYVFMLSSIFSNNTTDGYIVGRTMMFMPWAFLFYLKSIKSNIHVISHAIVLSLCLLEGGVYALAYICVYTGLYACLSTIRDFKKNRYRYLTTYLAAIVLFVALSSVKLLPLIELASQYPRLTENDMFKELQVYSGYSLEMLYYGLLGTYQTSYHPILKHSVWDMYSAYVGPIALALALYGIALSWRKHWPIIAIMAFGLILVYGTTQEEMVLWNAIHKLPGFSSLRGPARFIIVPLLCMAVLSGLGLARIEEKHKGVSSIIVIAVFLNLLYVSTPTLDESFVIHPKGIEESPYFIRTTDNPDRIWMFSNSYQNFLEHHGLTNTYGTLAYLSNYRSPMKGLVDKSYSGEAYLASGEPVEIVSLTPNSIAVKPHATGDDTLIVNQPYYSGWKTNAGETHPKDGLLSVDVTPQTQTVELYYSPDSFKIGTAITLLTITAILLYYKRCFGRHSKKE